jgi:hypothetical protein
MRNAIAAGMIAAAFSGCGMGPDYTVQQGCPPGYATSQAAPAAQTVAVYGNPIFIPATDPQCAWETIVDVVDDYFPIAHEEPIRADTPTAGSLTTFPEVSPTIFEPWRHDTVDHEQRVENTLQTMQRWAKVDVTPTQGGYMVEVAVFKELEDAIRPDLATAGGATFRFDSTLTGIVNPVTDEQASLGWIGRGRDASMEQYIIGHLLSRCGQAGQGQVAQPMMMRGQSK